MVFSDIDSDHYADFNAWYKDDHVGDLLKFPGFLNATRYQALKGFPRYLGMYELESMGALQFGGVPEILPQPVRADPTNRAFNKGPQLSPHRLHQIYPQENDSHILGRAWLRPSMTF